VSFTTLGAKPVIVSQSVANQSPTPFAAEVDAAINPESQVTTYWLEYSQEASLAKAVTIGEAALPAIFEEAAAGPFELAGLQPATTYFYRVVARNATGQTNGPMQSFETKGLVPPVVESETLTEATSTSALVSALVNPEFQETVCRGFQYVPHAQFVITGFAGAREAPCLVGGIGPSRAEATGAQLSGLTPNTTYDYRANVEGPNGATAGAAETFLTLPLPPRAITKGASSITANAATIAGEVVPGSVGPNSATTYFFEFGLTTSYGGQLPVTPGSAGEGTTPVQDSASLTGLAPGSIYHYRIVASNDVSGAPQKTYGADATFTTATTPPLLDTVSVANVSQNAATITASLAPAELMTHYALEVGSTRGSGLVDASGSTLEPQTLSLAVGGLNPSTLYYYRLSAINADGTAEVEGTFVTATAPVPSSGLLQPPAVILLPVPPLTFPGTLASSSSRREKAAGDDLSSALKRCVRFRNRRKRAKCERDAHRQAMTKRHT
jgi:hypothetical protein